MAVLRSEDGTPLEIKEGIVLNADGSPAAPEREPLPRIHVWRGGWLLGTGLLLLAPWFFLAGFALLAILIVLMAVLALLRPLFSVRRWR